MQYSATAVVLVRAVIIDRWPIRNGGASQLLIACTIVFHSVDIGWPVMAYALIGREDVAATLASNNSAAAGSAAKQSVHPAKGSCSSGSEQAVTAGKTHATAPTALQPPAAAPHQARGPDVAAQSVQQQHLLLPYEQRLLLPSSSRRCDHSRHGKGLHPTAETLSTGKHSSVGHSRRTGRSWGRGLRAAGIVAGSGAASAEQFNLGPATEFAAPIDGMDGLLDGVSVLRFGRDERLAEVRALLSTHMPVALSVSAGFDGQCETASTGFRVLLSV